MRRMLACLLALLMSFAPSVAFAWGTMGHSVVAEIAQRRLSSAAARQVLLLLGPGHSLASVSSWADGVAHSNPATSRWHYVNIPLASDTYDAATECAATSNGDCIIAELARLQDEMRCGATTAERADALKFAVHFIGDLHQPLHTVAEATGGNDVYVSVRFNGPACTASCEPNFVKLHAVWDSTMIEHTYFDWGSYVDYLEAHWLTTSEAASAHGGTPTDWMLEAHKLAAPIWVRNGASLNDDYYQQAMPVIDRQLGRAGLRLADYLNQTFSSRQCAPRTHH